MSSNPVVTLLVVLGIAQVLEIPCGVFSKNLNRIHRTSEFYSKIDNDKSDIIGFEKEELNFQSQPPIIKEDALDSHLFDSPLETNFLASPIRPLNSSIRYGKQMHKRSVRVPHYMMEIYQQLLQQQQGSDAPRDEDSCGDMAYYSVPNKGGGNFRGCGHEEATFNLELNEDESSYLAFHSARLYVEIIPKKKRRKGGNPLRRIRRRYSRAEVTVGFMEDGGLETLWKKVNVSGTTVEAVFDVSSSVRRRLAEKRTESGTGVNLQTKMTLNLQIPIAHNRKKRICRKVRWDASLLVSWEDATNCAVADNKSEEAIDEESGISMQAGPLFDSPEGRPRRSQGRSSSTKKDTKGCRLESLEVDFRDIGWNMWIISPLAYNAHTCMGDCFHPLPHHHDPSNHALVTSMLKEVKNIGKGPCCVPVAYDPLQILYYNDENQVVLRKHEDMVATQCGCR